MAGSPGGTGVYNSTTPKKVVAKKTDLTDPNTNPYPNDPNAKFVNGQWMDVATPAQKKSTAAALAKKVVKSKGQNAFQKWLNSQPNKGAAPTTSAFDPLAGMPQQTALTAFPTFNPSTLPDGSDVPDTPGHAFKPGTAQLVDPKQYAKLAGSASFQPLIDSLTSQQSRLGSGVADANSMLDKSYGDAATGSLRGAQIVSDSNKQANQSLTDLAARMAQAAGGDPTAAAAVGQTTANQEAGNTRFADIASQAQADQAAAANRDLGTAKLAYKGTTDKAIADLATQVGQAKTQGSQAQAKAITDALGFNSSQQTAQQGRDVAGQEAWLAGQLAGPQITAGKLANEGTRAGLKLQQHTAAVNDWTTLNSSKRTQYLDAVTKWTNKNVAQQMKTALAQGKQPAAELALADPTARAAVEQDVMGSMLSKNGPLANPAVMYKNALTTLKTEYPDSSPVAIKKLAQIFVNKQLPAWNSGAFASKDADGNDVSTPHGKWKFQNGTFVLIK